jgi:hypothetical protein
VYRIIDGSIYEVKRSQTRLQATIRQLGDHREGVITAPLEMVELDPKDPAWWYWHDKLTKPKTKQQEREAEEANAERVARRRKTEARRRSKANGHTYLLTGTYRASQGDLALAWKHWKEFVRRVRRVWPGFSYVVAWEPQKRGALHWHAAVHRVPQRLVDPKSGQPLRGKANSYNVLRAIWRSVIGDLGGTVNVAKYCRHKQRSPARIAAYIAKYVHKAHGWAPKGANVWAASYVELEPPLKAEFARDELIDAIALVNDICGGVGRELCSAWIAPWGDTIYLATEPVSVDRSIHSAPIA